MRRCLPAGKRGSTVEITEWGWNMCRKVRLQPGDDSNELLPFT